MFIRIEEEKLLINKKYIKRLFSDQQIDLVYKIGKYKTNIYKIKQQLPMNFQESFPVFDLQMDCDFESSDQKFNFQRKQNTSQTLLLEDGNVAALSTIGKRNANLDTFSYLKKDSCCMLAVFDGHGDDKVANYLKLNLLQRLSDSKLLESQPQKTIKSVLAQMEEQVLQKFEKGSTALLAIITDSQIIAANVGDSKLFAIKKDDGKLLPLTREHDLSNQSEVAEIMSKGGLIFKRGSQYRINGELNISRTIGDKKHKSYMSAQPEIYRFNKNDYKKIILATDGFFKHQLFESELCKRSIKEIENKIRKGILGYGFDDNATVLSFKLKSNSPNSTAEDFFKQNFQTLQ